MWDERYNASDYAYGKNPNNFLQQHAGRLSKGKVLCLADGEGRNGVFLAQQGFSVTSVDASAVGLAKAARLAQEKGVTIECIHADLNDFAPGEAQWDSIVSIFCHLPPPLRTRVHQRVVRALKPGGTFLLEAYTPAQLEFGTGGPSVAEMMMTAQQLREELAGLTFELLQETEREVIEGLYHTGRASVVQLLGKKARD